MHIFRGITIGIGATLAIDLWALLLRTKFGVHSLDFCLLGRWLLHMPEGRIMHRSVTASSSKPAECAVGWIAHYSIGVAFAVLFVGVMPDTWLQRPTLVPALTYGILTVVVPFFTLQPAFGMGIAASRTANPAVARLRSLGTHAVFGAGLYVAALFL